MKIRIKIKTLMLVGLGFILLVFFLIPKGNILIARGLDQMGSPYAQVFYERYLDQNFRRPSLPMQLHYAKTLVEGFNRYGIFSGHRGGSTDNRPEDLERAKKVLEEGIARKENIHDHEHYYIEAYRLLMDLYITTGDMESFQHGLEISTGDSEELLELQRVYRAYYEVYFGDLDRGQNLLQEGNKEYHVREREILFTEIALRKGDLDQAITHINQGELHRSGNFDDLGGRIFGTGAFQYQSMWMDNYIENLSGNYTLSGQVTFEGEPMPFVEVYIKEGGDQSWSTAGERMVAITDKNGYFESIGLRRRSYNVGIGIDSSRLYDKYFVGIPGELSYGQLLLEEGMHLEIEFVKPIEFSEISSHSLQNEKEELTLIWDSVPGAAYYQVSILSFANPREMTGSHGQMPLITKEGVTKIQETQATFTPKKINARGTGGIVTFSDEERLLGPTGVLRPILPGVEYPLIIKAYDEEGRELTSSLTLRGDYRKVPSFSVEGKLSKGEELILNQQYPEAINYYNERMEEEEIRNEALRTLSLIYYYGWKQGEEDPGMARYYAKKYYQETGHSEILGMIIASLSLEELQQNRMEVENILASIGEIEDPFFIQQIRANLYIIDRQWKQAIEVYEESEDYLPWDVFYLDLFMGDYETAAERLRDSRLHLYRIDFLMMEEALEDLSEEGLKDSEEAKLKKLMETLIVDGRNQGEVLYRNILTEVESDALKSLLFEISRFNNWDRN